MVFDFASTKTLVRQTVHDTLAVQAFYKVNSISSSTEIKARWHEKLVLQGQMENQGAEVYENADRVVFDRAAMDLLSITRSRGNIIIFPAYQNLEVSLDVMLPYEGPVEEIWLVTRL